MPELDRRDFLKLVGVGAGTAAAACAEPVEKLVPYVIQPEDVTPGVASYYASTCTECPASCGIVVKTREARPIKLEGNPENPINRGKLCARGQASLGRTYHPDRIPGPSARGGDNTLQPITWEEGMTQLASALQENGAVLSVDQQLAPERRHRWTLAGQGSRSARRCGLNARRGGPCRGSHHWRYRHGCNARSCPPRRRARSACHDLCSARRSSQADGCCAARAP